MADFCHAADRCVSRPPGEGHRIDGIKHALQTFQDSKNKKQKCLAVSDRETLALSEKMIEECKETGWSKITNDLVQYSTFPFLFLSIPQLIHNAINLKNGNFSALSILSWKACQNILKIKQNDF